MTFKIPLQVEGVDLENDDVVESFDEVLASLGWRSKGRLTTATVYQSAVDLGAACDMARQISKKIPGACVPRVHEELVTISGIAGRCGKSDETVRLWTTGKRRAGTPFPAARTEVLLGGNGLTALWAWAEVLAWVRDVLGIDPEEGAEYLTARQVAELNADLADHAETTRVRPFTHWSETVLRSATPLAPKLASVGTIWINHAVVEWKGSVEWQPSSLLERA